MRNADEILVMDKGRVVEKGDHESLLAHGGLYASLVSKQAGGGLTGSDAAVRASAVQRPSLLVNWFAHPLIHISAASVW